MATKIKQGDAYALPIQIRLNGELIGVEDVEAAEFCLGDGLRKLYPGLSRTPSPSRRTAPSRWTSA